MSDINNDVLREQIYEEATECVDLMIEDKEITSDRREDMIFEIYSSMYAERDFSIEAQTDDDSGEEDCAELDELGDEYGN